MIVRELELKNFRNLNIKLAPSPSFNLITGNNGSGKSNLLDCLYYFALAKSFKPYALKNNINIKQVVDFGLISAKVNNDDLIKQLKIVFSHSGEESEHKRFEVNEKPTTKAKFTSHLYVILFAPHNINLVVGTPQLRREEFDDYCSICDFKYALDLEEYEGVIKNRNRLLRAINEGKANIMQLPYWNEKLIDLGSKLIYQRQNIINALNPIIYRFSKEYLKPELKDFKLSYISKFVDKDNDNESESIKPEEKEFGIELNVIKKRFAQKIAGNQDTEIAVKQTLYGPQKDDYAFILSDQYDLKTFGSRGQQRMITLILKLAMWEYLFLMKESKPIILLDDIMSELDEGNKKILEKIVERLECQTFITTTHENDFSKGFREKMNITKLGI
jgi:DNA replication and repair protein RecF